VIANLSRVMFVIGRLKVAAALAGSWVITIVADVVLLRHPDLPGHAGPLSDPPPNTRRRVERRPAAVMMPGTGPGGAGASLTSLPRDCCSAQGRSGRYVDV
jgi:hypothetical protein